jgi:hypothetical protein
MLVCVTVCDEEISVLPESMVQAHLSFGAFFSVRLPI